MGQIPHSSEVHSPAGRAFWASAPSGWHYSLSCQLVALKFELPHCARLSESWLSKNSDKNLYQKCILFQICDWLLKVWAHVNQMHCHSLKPVKFWVLNNPVLGNECRLQLASHPACAMWASENFWWLLHIHIIYSGQVYCQTSFWESRKHSPQGPFNFLKGSSKETAQEVSHTVLFVPWFGF